MVCRPVIAPATNLLYNTCMTTKFISGKASPLLIEYLKANGYDLRFVASDNLVSEGIDDHADLFYCRLGCKDEAEVFEGTADSLAKGYPSEARFNGACTGRFFIHNLSITDPGLLSSARALDMTIVNVRQGYTRCSTIIVDEDSIITYDKGIAAPCQAAGMKVLTVSPGHIMLKGYDTGLIGGTSGRCGGEIVFNGDLSAHPDFIKIKEFIESCGLSCHWFSQYPLTDIGSII